MIPGLGRLPAPDSRDLAYPLRATLPPKTLRIYRYWYAPLRLDQGFLPWCVDYGWIHFHCGSPKPHSVAPLEPGVIYNQAQLIDEWPGEDYDGTSVRAGAKVMQSQGLISEYRWGWTLNDAVMCVLEQGPVVLGTNWYERMFDPESDDFIRIGGDVAGGHAYILDGVNTTMQRARILNSWGPDWGRMGRAFISFVDLERLIDEQGEVCLALE